MKRKVVMYTISSPQSPCELSTTLDYPIFTGEEKYEVALAELSIDNRLQNKKVGSCRHCPTLTFQWKKPAQVTLEDLQTSQACYIPHIPLDQRDLVLWITYNSKKSFNPMQLYFTYSLSEDRGYFYVPVQSAPPYLWIHENLATYFFGPDVPNNPDRTTFIGSYQFSNGAKYFVSDLGQWSKTRDNNNLMLKTKEGYDDFALPLVYPVIEIISEDVQDPLGQRRDSVSLLTFTPHFSQIAKTKESYVTYQPERLTFMPLKTRHPQNFHLEIRSLRGEKIPLIRPAIAKLVFRPCSNTMEHCLSVASGNVAKNSFCLDLNNPLISTQSRTWKLALSSITVPSTFHSGLSDEERSVTILRGVKKNHITHEFTLPASFSSPAMLASSIEAGARQVVEVNADPDSGILKFSDITDETGTVLKMHKKLALFLGFDPGLVESSQEEDDFISITATKDKPFYFTRPPFIEANRPVAIKVHCGEVEPSLINGRASYILRVTPINFIEGSPFSFLDFKFLDFKNFTTDRISQLHFWLTDLNDEPLKFDSDRLGEYVHINLILKIQS